MTDPAPASSGPAAELAVPLSIAVRIEPELIRAIRLAVLPHLDVSAESDLWFADDLVASRGPDTIVFRPEVLPRLRAQLADRVAAGGPADPVRLAGDITARVHASVSPALVLEERVTWLAVTRGEDGRAAIEEELRPALLALVKDGRTGIANWLAGAWERLPEAVRGTTTAWQLRQAASAHADIGRLPSEVVPAGLGVADLADLVRGFDRDADVAVPVRLAGGLLELGDIGPLPGAAAIPLLDTDPRVVELLRDDDSGTTITVPRGGRASAAAGRGPARLLTPRGLVYEVTPYVPPRTYVPLAGSERQPLPFAYPAIRPLDLSARAEVTVVLRRRSPLPDAFTRLPVQLSREELSARYGADPADADLATGVLTAHGLTVRAVDAGSRRAFVEGTLGALAETFGTDLNFLSSEHPDGTGRVTHRYRLGPLHVPAELDGVITAVLGLDDRPQARPCVRWHPERDLPDLQLRDPREVAGIYGFPLGAEGHGQTLAIVDFGDALDGSQLDVNFLNAGMKQWPQRTLVSVHRAGTTPVSGGQESSAGAAPFSLSLPLFAVAGLIAPGADNVAYYAPNTARGFLDALTEAIHAQPTPTALTVGWGEAEDSWTPQARTAISEVLADAAVLGVTVCVAAGDFGSGSARSDAQSRVYFPASSPYALACGGTSLIAEHATPGGAPEVVWPATGGGVSDVFALPAWQANAGVPPQIDGGGLGRGVPDVAANADPARGYPFRDGATKAAFGGTGTVAALWAALVCLLAQITGKRPGHLQPLLYEGISPGVTPPGFRAITQGNNGAYRAGPGWNACTGLGSPNGTELVDRLRDGGLRSGKLKPALAGA
jgi:kumamolisin